LDIATKFAIIKLTIRAVSSIKNTQTFTL